MAKTYILEFVVMSIKVVLYCGTYNNEYKSKLLSNQISDIE